MADADVKRDNFKPEDEHDMHDEDGQDEVRGDGALGKRAGLMRLHRKR